jgi:hypothetical protein
MLRSATFRNCLSGNFQVGAGGVRFALGIIIGALALAGVTALIAHATLYTPPPVTVCSANERNCIRVVKVHGARAVVKTRKGWRCSIPQAREDGLAPEPTCVRAD